jgi:fatty acid desaturase
MNQLRVRVITWLILDYTLLYTSLYLIYSNRLWIIRDFMLAMAITRCQYQHHDFAHGQFDKLQLFNKNVMHMIFTFTSGFSTEYWTNVEHMPHHIHVNNFDIDPDNFVALVQSNYVYLLLITIPTICIKSLIYVIRIKKYTSASVNMLSLVHLTLFIYYYTVDYIMFSVFYIFTFAVTQWFHHPKIYTYDTDSLRRQVVNSRNIKGHNFIINYWMGGHDYQIEHHLYPKSSRYELPELSAKVKEKYVDIYTEITVGEALCELFRLSI